MIDVTAPAVISAAPEIDAPDFDANATEPGAGEEGFDRDAALAALRGDAPAEEPKAEEPVEAKSDEQQTEEERLANKRKKLSDEKGKLEQDKLDGAFAKLTAQQRRFKAQVAEHRETVAKFDAAKADYDAAIEKAAGRVNTSEKEFNDRRERAKTNPLSAFEELGWTVERLVKFIQNDGKHTPEEQIKDTRAEYEERFSKQAQELNELRDKLKQDGVRTSAKAFEQRATETVRGLMKDYELVSKYDLATEVMPKVLQNMAHIYREGGTIDGKTYPKGTALDPKVLLDYFEGQESKALARFGFRPGQTGAASGAAKSGAAQPKTLSNADTSSRSVKSRDDDGEFDRDAAMSAVHQMLNG